jgi:hypothetical protein
MRVTLIGCEASNNGRDGFHLGADAQAINCKATNNGRHGFYVAESQSPAQPAEPTPKNAARVMRWMGRFLRDTSTAAIAAVIGNTIKPS